MDVEPGPSNEPTNGSNDAKKKFKRNQKGSDRRKPYFGSQQEGQGFADLRKKKAAREYLKLLQKEGVSGKESGRTPLKLFDILGRPSNKTSKNHSSFSQAKKVGEEKLKRKQEEKEKFLEEKEAKEKAMTAYKAKKKERFLKLCKKTRKGQPVMKNQMEVLLEKIMKHKGMNSGGSENATG